MNESNERDSLKDTHSSDNFRQLRQQETGKKQDLGRKDARNEGNEIIVIKIQAE